MKFWLSLKFDFLWLVSDDCFSVERRLRRNAIAHCLWVEGERTPPFQPPFTALL